MVCNMSHSLDYQTLQTISILLHYFGVPEQPDTDNIQCVFVGEGRGVWNASKINTICTQALTNKMYMPYTVGRHDEKQWSKQKLSHSALHKTTAIKKEDEKKNKPKSNQETKRSKC